MLKKVVLTVFVTMLIGIALGIGSASAYEVDGLISGLTVTPAYINPGGLGDSLIYSYYNVRGNLNLFNIVNTSYTDGVKVRVIFREAKDSREVLDFSVCLSKGDVWTAYIVDDGTAARIYAYDTDTITAPAIPSAGQQFKYGASNINTHLDGSSITADDTKEGYFEVLGLSVIPNYDKNSSNTAACTVGGSATNCIRTSQACADWGKTAGVNTPAPENTLMGNNTIVEGATLATYSYNATAFADAVQLPIADPGPGQELSLFNDSTTGCYQAEWILSKYAVKSPYDIISVIGGETELITLFPTRAACHEYYPDTFFECVKENPDDPGVCMQYCTKVHIDAWDDKEKTYTILDFSPAGKGLCLPHELNVLKVGGSAIWNTGVGNAISVGSFDLGWLNIGLGTQADNDHITSYCYNANTGYYLRHGACPIGDSTIAVADGLPMLAYTTQSFLGGDASYMVPAFYETNITVQQVP